MAKRRRVELVDPIGLDLPSGPPLHLEVPGNAVRHLAAFVLPERLARMEAALGTRTRHLTALLDHVHDPHNISACVRSTDACGLVDMHLVTPGGAPLPLSAEVASGTHRWVRLHHHASPGAAVEHLRAHGYRIVATDLRGDAPPTDLFDLDTSAPLCVAFGNEHAGIGAELRDLADARLRIPMYGFVESLNISVAFAVTMFTLRAKVNASRGPAGDLGAEEARRLLDRWLVADIGNLDRIVEVLAARALQAERSAD